MDSISIIDIADFVKGELSDNTDVTICGVSAIEQAKAGDLSFISNPKYIKHLYTTKASVVIVDARLELKDLGESPTLLRVQDAYLAICMILNRFFNPLKLKKGVEMRSFVNEAVQVPDSAYIGAFSYLSEGVKLGENVQIYPNVFIGENTTIGDNTVIYSGVSVYAETKIGKNCIIHSGTVVGSDGFGHAPMPDGTYIKIPQVGNVIIEDNVEIGSNCSIDRATLGSTIIRKGVKLDNLIQVAHNVEIGENTVIASQTGISGTTKLGANCVIGGQVGFAGHIQIADKSRIGAQSGIPNSIKEPGKDWMGTPVIPLRENLKNMAILRNLSSLIQRIAYLESIIKTKKENNDT